MKKLEWEWVEVTFFFRKPKTDNAKRSQSSVLLRALHAAPTSIKPLEQNWTQEISSHGFVFPNPKDEVGLVVLVVQELPVFVNSDIVSKNVIEVDKVAVSRSLALGCHCCWLRLPRGWHHFFRRFLE